MRTKPADIPYCGVDKNKIQKAKPTVNEVNLRHLYNYILERYRIHTRKDVRMLPEPWTRDPILDHYRFTNIRREHDKETRYVIENIVRHKQATYEDKLLNIILFRLFNKHQTFQLLKGPINFKKYDPDKLISRLNKADEGYVYFTGAYLSSGMKRTIAKTTPPGPPHAKVIHFVDQIRKSPMIERIKAAKTQLEAFQAITMLDGIGAFLGYQIFVDFTYIPQFPFSENEFTVCGPGAISGLNYIFDTDDGLTPEELVFWLRDNIDRLFLDRKWVWTPQSLFFDLPQYDRYMNLMSLENCMCEISKYIKVVEGTGRPRQKYYQKGGSV